MPAVVGRAAGFIGELSHSATAPAATTAVGLETFFSTAANSVIDVSDMGSLDREREVIDVPVYGADTAGKLAGQADPGTFDFEVTMNFDNAKHVALRDDSGRTVQHFVLRYGQSSTNRTYAYFTGFIANASMGQPIDGRITMSVSVARAGDVTWANMS